MSHKKGLKGHRPHRLHAGWLLSAALLCAVLMTGKADALYILTGAEDSAIVLDAETDVRPLSTQFISVNTKSSSGPELTLAPGRTVSIRYEGADLTVTSKQETVAALLDRVHIEPGPLDMIAVDVSQSIIRMEVASDLTVYDRVRESDPAPVVRRANSALAQGVEQTVQQGQDGTRVSTYEVVYANGKEVSRQLVDISDSTAVPTIVEYGTQSASVSSEDRISAVTPEGDGGVLAFASGNTLRYSKVLQMTATAYTTGHDGVGTRTATGTAVHKGTVAVDPKVIPLGTRLYIVTDGGVVYGTAVAEDTGVRGNRIDLYYDTYQQCINFGRRACTVYVLD